MAKFANTIVYILLQNWLQLLSSNIVYCIKCLRGCLYITTVRENRIHKLGTKHPHGLICAWLALYRRTIDTYRQHTIELEFPAPVGRTKPTDPALPPLNDHKLPSSPTFACHFAYLTRRRPQSQNRLSHLYISQSIRKNLLISSLLKTALPTFPFYIRYYLYTFKIVYIYLYSNEF